MYGLVYSVYRQFQQYFSYITLKAIYESRKILLVITEHFLTRDWPLLKIVIDNTIKHRPESIVLILLGKCPIPKEIQQLPVFDLTMRSRIPFGIS
jgi:hypothetical protein